MGKHQPETRVAYESSHSYRSRGRIHGRRSSGNHRDTSGARRPTGCASRCLHAVCTASTSVFVPAHNELSIKGSDGPSIRSLTHGEPSRHAFMAGPLYPSEERAIRLPRAAPVRSARQSMQQNPPNRNRGTSENSNPHRNRRRLHGDGRRSNHLHRRRRPTRRPGVRGCSRRCAPRRIRYLSPHTRIGDPSSLGGGYRGGARNHIGPWIADSWRTVPISCSWQSAWIPLKSGQWVSVGYPTY